VGTISLFRFFVNLLEHDSHLACTQIISLRLLNFANWMLCKPTYLFDTLSVPVIRLPVYQGQN
jgi:hypothetical protein